MTIRIEPAPQAHKNPGSTRTASAPYNFVPLPEVVVTAVSSPNDLPSHNTYADEKFKHTGYFDVTLTTRSPLYVRAALTLEQFAKQERGDEAKDDFRALAKNTPDFFYTRKKEAPVIPGSSLRGMLRALLEIVSYGKMTRVSDKRLFYRTVDPTAVGKAYSQRMMSGDGSRKNGYKARVKPGIFRKHADGSGVIETCDSARVEMEMVAKAFGLPDAESLYDGKGPRARPNWKYQHKTIWVQMEPTERDHPHSQGKYLRYRKVTAVSTTPTTGQEAILILTGPMQRKHLAFVFFKQPGPQLIEVDEKRVEEFQDKDQVTLWQRDAFPDGEPKGSSRGGDGNLRDAEPVFYLEENGALSFFGRAQMFRLPYENRPLDLLPQEFQNENVIDFAEAMFGFVREDAQAKQGAKARAYASRVSITDAQLVSEYPPEKLWLTRNALTPPILATPKPTAFQQYLVQLTDRKKILTHYDSPTTTDDGEESPKTTLRGHKLYWHQGNRTVQQLSANPPPSRGSTQHTQFRPVRDGVQFKFRVYFENLSEEELGALCWTLQPLGETGKEYCHALGMGKPFGMGAVQLEATLHLTDRVARYGALFAGNTWATAEQDKELHSYRARFEELMLQELQPNRPLAHLSEMPRIAMLLKMMEFPGFAAGDLIPGTMYLQDVKRPNTRYMTIRFDPKDFPNLSAAERNEFRERPVLPDVTAFDANLKVGARSIAYEKDVELTATVDDEKEGYVYLTLPNQDVEKRYGIIDPENRRGQVFTRGEMIAVKILGFDEDDSAMVVCAPRR